MTHPHPPATLTLLTQVAPWHNSLRHTHPHPTAYEKEKKIVRQKKNRWWKRWGGPRKEWIRHISPTHAVLAHLFHPLSSGSGTTALPTLYDILSHLLHFSHRSCVVVSPVPAACPMWLLDTRLVCDSPESWLARLQGQSFPTLLCRSPALPGCCLTG